MQSPLREETTSNVGERIVDVVGIGVGPANLSLAALLDPQSDIRCKFVDRNPKFQWHPGLLFPDAALQVPYVKDLVTLVDPTNRFSFLSFLAHKKRLYAFMNASFGQVLRREFSEYYGWVCDQLSSLAFGCEATETDCTDSGFVIQTTRGRMHTRSLVVGTGLHPNVPPCAVPHIGDTVFHASELLSRAVDASTKRVIVVGGGQSGAEVFLHLLSRSEVPAELYWISRRWNYSPLDEAPFTNELFTPHYSDYFFGLPSSARRSLLTEQKLASDGISSVLLQSIYRRLYELRFVNHQPCKWQLRPGRELVEIFRDGNKHRLVLDHAHKNTKECVDADLVILCTGYAWRMPSYLEPLKDRIAWENDAFVVNEDFSVVWDGPNERKIFAQNAARPQRGIADPNLSLAAWRSAKIANSVLGRVAYDVEPPPSLVTWDVDQIVEPIHTGTFLRQMPGRTDRGEEPAQRSQRIAREA